MPHHTALKQSFGIFEQDRSVFRTSDGGRTLGASGRSKITCILGISSRSYSRFQFVEYGFAGSQKAGNHPTYGTGSADRSGGCRSFASGSQFGRVLSDGLLTNGSGQCPYLDGGNHQLNHHYLLVEHHLESGDSISAVHLFDSIPVYYSLNTAEQAAYARYDTLLTHYFGLQGFDDPLVYISSHQTELESLASNTDRAGVLTQGLLNAYLGMTYWPPIELPSGGSPSMAIPNIPAEQESSKAIQEEAPMDGSLYVIPNPVRDEMEIYFNLSGEQKASVLAIVNLQGVVVQEWEVYPPTDRIAYSTQHLSKGVYVVYLRHSIGEIQSFRFVITR
jgi:hypothetical protein